MTECEEIYMRYFFNNYNFKDKKYLEIGSGHLIYSFFNIPLKNDANVTVIEHNKKYTKEYPKNINLINKNYLDVDLEKEHNKYDILFIKGLPLRHDNSFDYGYDNKNKVLEMVERIEHTLKDDGKGFIWFYINEKFEKKGHLDFVNEYFSKKNWKIYEFTKHENLHKIVHYRKDIPKGLKRFLFLKNIDLDLDSISKLKLHHNSVNFL